MLADKEQRKDLSSECQVDYELSVKAWQLLTTHQKPQSCMILLYKSQQLNARTTPNYAFHHSPVRASTHKGTSASLISLTLTERSANMSSSPQASAMGTPWTRPTRLFREECLSILFHMDLDHSGSSKLFTVTSETDGHAIAGFDASYDRALFARVVSNLPVEGTDLMRPMRLHLELAGLYDALRWLVIAGPGHTVKMYCCEFWFGDKCDVNSGEFERWDKELERLVRKGTPGDSAGAKDCQACPRCGYTSL